MKPKIFEVRFTRNSFLFGFGWSDEYDRHFAIVLGCFILRFNFSSQIKEIK